MSYAFQVLVTFKFYFCYCIIVIGGVKLWSFVVIMYFWFSFYFSRKYIHFTLCLLILFHFIVQLYNCLIELPFWQWDLKFSITNIFLFISSCILIWALFLVFVLFLGTCIFNVVHIFCVNTYFFYHHICNLSSHLYCFTFKSILSNTI